MVRIALLVLLVLGAAACGPDATLAPTALAFSRCGEAQQPVDGEIGPRHKFCAQITITESKGFERIVQLLVVSDQESNPLADRRVLVYHPGGPGISAVELVGEDPLPVDMQQYAILTWDGTTSSAVPGACGPASNAFGVDRDPRRLAEDAPKVAEECMGGFGGPDDIGALEAAAELEAIRQAIGVQQFDILGVSYGTAVAEEYLRTHANSVRRAVLDGPLALEASWAARVQAVGQALSESADVLARGCVTDRCLAATGDGQPSFSRIRQALVNAAPPVGGGNTVLTATMIDQATLLALRSQDYWAPWAVAVDNALGGDGTDLWALGEKEYFDLDRAVFYRSICADINLPPDPASFGTSQFALLRTYTSGLAPCTGFPHRPLPPAPADLQAEVLILASSHDPLTPFALLDSAPELRGFGAVCRTDVMGHTSLRDPVYGPIALGFLAGTSPGEPC